MCGSDVNVGSLFKVEDSVVAVRVSNVDKHV
jgi:hypothetical protein